MFFSEDLQYLVTGVAVIGIVLVGVGLILLRFGVRRKFTVGALGSGAVCLVAAVVGYALSTQA